MSGVLASVTAAANKVPIAGGAGTIDAAWLPAAAIVAGTAVGGDLTGTLPNPTIAADAVTNAKLANMATKTVKGNATGGSANPTDLTTANLAAMFGTPDGTKFLADDGTLKTPSGGSSGVTVLDESADYTLVLADVDTLVRHPSADTTPRTFTIPANGSVAFPVGTTVAFLNEDSAGAITIAITTDTLKWVGTGGTGSRTLAAGGMATAVKVSSTLWWINGVGLT